MGHGSPSKNGADACCSVGREERVCASSLDSHKHGIFTMSSAFLRLVVDAGLEVTGKGRLIIINKFPENNIGKLYYSMVIWLDFRDAF